MISAAKTETHLGEFPLPVYQKQIYTHIEKGTKLYSLI